MNADSTWGLTSGDRRFLAISLAIMAVLLAMHGWREWDRRHFQVQVVRGEIGPLSADAQPMPVGRTAEAQPTTAHAKVPVTASVTGVSYRLDINTAPWEAWLQLDGIGETLARRIVEDRDRNGPFRSIDDVTRVKGIGAKTLAKMRPHLTINDSSVAAD